MSLPAFEMVCERCHAEVGRWFLGAPRPMALYKLPTGAIAPLTQRHQWCAKCTAVVFAEHIPTYDEISRDLERIGRRSPAQFLQQFVSRAPLRTMHELNRQVLRSEQAWRLWAVQQSSREGRCLTCSCPSSVLTASGMKGGFTTYMHPCCGGAMQWRELPVRYAWPEASKVELRWFNMDGTPEHPSRGMSGSRDRADQSSTKTHAARVW